MIPQLAFGAGVARRRFGLQSMAFAMLMLVLSLTCFTHASTSEQDDIGLVELPLPIPSSTTIKLRTLDQQVLQTTAGVVSRSTYITAFFTDDFSPATTEIPVPAIAQVMAKVLIWLDHHQGQVFPPRDPRLGGSASDWDLEFCKAMSAETFMLMMKASTELNLWPLSNLGNFHIGNLVRGKSQEQIRALLQIGWAWYAKFFCVIAWSHLLTCTIPIVIPRHSVQRRHFLRSAGVCVSFHDCLTRQTATN